MKRIRLITLYTCLLVAALFALGGCSSARVDEGVTIEKSGNPLKFW